MRDSDVENLAQTKNLQPKRSRPDRGHGNGVVNNSLGKSGTTPTDPHGVEQFINGNWGVSNSGSGGGGTCIFCEDCPGRSRLGTLQCHGVEGLPLNDK